MDYNLTAKSTHCFPLLTLAFCIAYQWLTSQKRKQNITDSTVFVIPTHPSDGNWKNTQLHAREDLGVNVASTEMSADDLDARSLVDTVLLINSQHGYEIFRQKSFLSEFTTEYLKYVIGIIGVHDVGCVTQNLSEGSKANGRDLIDITRVAASIYVLIAKI